MDAQLAMDRIHHRIAAGMIENTHPFTVFITTEEARALLAETYSALNSKYLDALRKGDGISPEEAPLQSRSTLKMLGRMREWLDKGVYNPFLADDSVTREFGFPLKVRENA